MSADADARFVQGLATWAKAHPVQAGLRAVLLVLAAFIAVSFLQQPRADRDWYPYLAQTAHVELKGETSFSVSPVSDWSYAGTDVVGEDYGAAEFALSDLRNVWFVLEPQPGSEMAAHTLLLFEFEGDKLLGLTIEARREQSEEYSVLFGTFNAFELSYVWASARDLLTRRAVMLDHEVFVYPIEISDQQKQTLLTRVLERTQSLEAAPRFYNTLFSNCTNELAKAADIPWHYSFILTGKSDEHLFAEGYIPGEDFEGAHARADVTALVKALNQEVAPEDFDQALLAGVRGE